MRNLFIALGISLISILILVVITFAATGDYVSSVNFTIDCSTGVGIAFDGTNLWYSCLSSPDLMRANVTTGVVTASYNITPGLGALSYDATRNAIWGAVALNKVYRIDLDASKNVVGSTLVFTVNDSCGIIDGLAFDAKNITDPNDDVFYYSDDCFTTVIDVYDLSGNPVESFSWAGTGAHNSGLAIGGQLLYEAGVFESIVYVVDKVTKASQFNYSVAVAGDPNFHPEDMECDTNTFASIGKHVMWIKEAYSPARAHAFEIPFGSCGIGGISSEICPETETDTMQLQTNRWMFNGTAWITKLPNGTGPQKSYTIEDTQGCSCKQILDWLHENHPEEYGNMLGHYKYGCSISIMDAFIELTSE